MSRSLISPPPTKALTLNLQVCRNRGDIARQSAEVALGRRSQSACIEIVVGEKPAKVVDDLQVSSFHAAKGVHPIGVIAVDACQHVNVARGEAAEESSERSEHLVPVGRCERFDPLNVQLHDTVSRVAGVAFGAAFDDPRTSSSQSKTRSLNSVRAPDSQCSPAPSSARNRSRAFSQVSAS